MFLACAISSATYCMLRHHACARISGAVNTEAVRAERAWRPSATNAGGLKLLRESAYGAEIYDIIPRYICVKTLAILYLSLRDTSSYYYISV